MKITHIQPCGLAAAFVLGCLIASPARLCAQTIVNGSFEDPVKATNSITEITSTGIPGWTGDSIGGSAHEYLINGNVQDLNGNNFGTTPFGQQYLGLNAVAHRSFHSIESQSDTGFVAGEEYQFTVYIADLDGATDPYINLTVSDGLDGEGTVLASQDFEAPVGTGPYGDGTIDFVPETLDFTALTDGVTLSIGNDSLTGVMGVDNVSLAAVPEPTTVATLLLGTAAFGGLAVRRRKMAAQKREDEVVAGW